MYTVHYTTLHTSRFLTWKKLALAVSTVGPLTTRTEDHLQPSHEEQRGIEAKCSEDAAGAEEPLALELVEAA